MFSQRIFALYVLFLYGPMLAIFVLSFQGPSGGLTFPMNGVSLHWFSKLYAGNGIVDLGVGLPPFASCSALLVMALTVVLSVAAGLAFRKKFRGSAVLFYTAVASLIVPSIVTSLGIALEFRLVDDVMRNHVL